MKGMKNIRKGSRGTGEEGFTLLEIIFTVSILSIGILAVASMQMASIQGNGLAGDLSEATCVATDQMEKLIQESYDDIASSPSPLTRGIYAVNWTVDEDVVYDNTKTVTLAVSWILRGIPKSVTIQRVIPRVI
ncbi:MAG: prepilin-type N-terminal cleavage/methylation domain-containing protein [Deltaproteobacteria bacterium]|nr:prepilin-type N-terminal cleavage/methylation domain-containing protein [Deltaproteobacteria bacterium]